MAAEVLLKLKFLSHVLYLCYAKFYFDYIFHSYVIYFIIYLYILYNFYFCYIFLFSSYLILNLWNNVFIFIIYTKLLQCKIFIYHKEILAF